MHAASQKSQPLRLVRRASPGSLPGLLRGYRLGVCTTPDEVARALAVRERVYVHECGYDVPVPDEFDARSWLLQAVCTETGETVGAMRVTPRFAGPLELETYFQLPEYLASPRVFELNRFSVLRQHRKGRMFMPAVALGLMKTAVQLLFRLGVSHAVLCAKEERIWTYQWMRFERTGMMAPYGRLAAAPHELLVADLRHGIEHYRDHRFWAFFADTRDPAIHLDALPALGIGIAPATVEHPAAQSA